MLQKRYSGCLSELIKTLVFKCHLEQQHIFYKLKIQLSVCYPAAGSVGVVPFSAGLSTRDGGTRFIFSSEAASLLRAPI